MAAFKNWLNFYEEKLSGDLSNPRADAAPVRTAQATSNAADSITGSPKFSGIQGKMIGLTGNRSAQQGALIDFTTLGLNNPQVVKPDIAKLTSPPHVAFTIQNKVGLPTDLPKPKFMRKR